MKRPAFLFVALAALFAAPVAAQPASGGSLDTAVAGTAADATGGTPASAEAAAQLSGPDAVVGSNTDIKRATRKTRRDLAAEASARAATARNEDKVSAKAGSRAKSGGGN